MVHFLDKTTIERDVLTDGLLVPSRNRIRGRRFAHPEKIVSTRFTGTILTPEAFRNTMHLTTRAVRNSRYEPNRVYYLSALYVPSLLDCLSEQRRPPVYP